MASEIYPFNAEENKLRRQWLIIACSYFILYPLLISLCLFLDSCSYSYMVGYCYSYSEYSIYIFFGLVQLGMLYHFAYKNNGTKLLSWSIYGSIGQIFRSTTTNYSALSRETKYALTVVALFDFVIVIPWIVVAIRLRRRNKAMQIQKRLGFS